MKAKITVEFRTLRPGDKKNSTVHAGEIVEGELAAWAINNGHGKQVADDTPMGKPEAKAAPAPAKAAKAEKPGKRKPEPEPDAGGAGEDDQGEGE
jgi:hypothetical protein